MIPFAEALAAIRALPTSDPAPQHRALEEAVGCVLALPALAAMPLPRFDHAAVDGWAVRLADCDPLAPTHLRPHGRVAAGDVAPAHQPGTATRIFTGAPVPLGADAVVMQEAAPVENGAVRLPCALRPGQNIRRRAEQAAAGATLLSAGHRLRSIDLALCTAAGLTAVSVRPALAVAVLSTGNEIRQAGAALDPAAVPDSNGPMLAAVLQARGATVDRIGPIPDEPAALAAALGSAARTHDLLITTGGVSVGEEDHLRNALAAVGTLLFWRVAMKPGRPTALGLVGSVPLLMLPGNPAAAFTAFQAIGGPLLRHLSGESETLDVYLRAEAHFTHPAKAGMTEFLPVRLRREGPRFLATTVDAKGGLTGLAAADGLAVLADGSPVQAGDELEVLVF